MGGIRNEFKVTSLESEPVEFFWGLGPFLPEFGICLRAVRDEATGRDSPSGQYNEDVIRHRGLKSVRCVYVNLCLQHPFRRLEVWAHL